jgi:serine/threonine-protein kinase
MLAEGAVLEQNPAPGAVAKPGAMVDIKVSRGAPPDGLALMPNFVGRPLAAARVWAEDRKISPEVKEELTDAFLPGLVIRQTPPPDAAVTENTPITIVVARSENLGAQDVAVIAYQVPAGSGRVQVRVVLRDDAGEREVFSSAQNAGSLVEIPVVPQGPARSRIFVNGVLVEERTVE